ncbi:unnamed protein product, partial [Ceratitis capitata]
MTHKLECKYHNATPHGVYATHFTYSYNNTNTTDTTASATSMDGHKNIFTAHCWIHKLLYTITTTTTTTITTTTTTFITATYSPCIGMQLPP